MGMISQQSTRLYWMQTWNASPMVSRHKPGLRKKNYDLYRTHQKFPCCAGYVLVEVIDAVYDQYDRSPEALAVGEGRFLDTVQDSFQLVMCVPAWQRPDLQHAVEEVSESDVLVKFDFYVYIC